jgi:hypothetical protein
MTLEQTLRALAVLMAVPEVPLNGRVRPTFTGERMSGFTVEWQMPDGEIKHVSVSEVAN